MTNTVEKSGRFWVYFVGTRNGRWIEAENMKSAKWILAIAEGLKSIGYIRSSKKGPGCDTI
jgi:hypothetical protein